MAEIPTVYSQRLGAIRDSQFAAACERARVGTFIRAEPTASGLFGQNVFLTTTAGEFVLRGAPHWVKAVHETDYWPQEQWQFTKETYFAHQLHEHTAAPVSWPWFHERTSDIFGWPFIVMRRMPGACIDQSSPLMQELSAADWFGIARALAMNLVEMQSLRSEFAGDIDIHTLTLQPYARGDTEHMITATTTVASASRQNGGWCDDDQEWLDTVVAMARGAGRPRPNTFVHRDYKLDNLTLDRDADGQWSVKGIFDLHTAGFGDGAYDVVRQALSFISFGAPALARTFVGKYFEAAPPDDSLRLLLPLYVAFERIEIWEYFRRSPETRDQFSGKTFRDWAEPQLELMLELVPVAR